MFSLSQLTALAGASLDANRTGETSYRYDGLTLKVRVGYLLPLLLLLLLLLPTTTTTTKVPPGGAGRVLRRRPPLRGQSARSRRAACRRARACDAAHAPGVRAEGGARAQQGTAGVRHSPLLLRRLNRARKRGESLIGRHGGGGAHDPPT